MKGEDRYHITDYANMYIRNGIILAHAKKACNRNRVFVGVGLPNPSTGGETPPLQFRLTFCTFFLHEPLYFIFRHRANLFARGSRSALVISKDARLAQPTGVGAMLDSRWTMCYTVAWVRKGRHGKMLNPDAGSSETTTPVSFQPMKFTDSGYDVQFLSRSFSTVCRYFCFLCFLVPVFPYYFSVFHTLVDRLVCSCCRRFILRFACVCQYANLFGKAYHPQCCIQASCTPILVLPRK